jgi:hypothetical protein
MSDKLDRIVKILNSENPDEKKLSLIEKVLSQPDPIYPPSKGYISQKAHKTVLSFLKRYEKTP